MGWWTTNKSGEELMQGDEPYDIMGEAFQKIAAEYQKEWNRKPTLSELLHTIQSVLSAGADDFFSDAARVDIVEVSVKTKTSAKKKSVQVGDVFAIPLATGYVFGRVFDSNPDDMGLLVGVYDGVSKKILSPESLKGSNLIFPLFFYGGDALRRDRWKIIGNLPIQPNEFTFPKFKEGHEGLGWWIREGNQKRPATEAEVRDLEYATLYPTEAVEDRIRKHFKM